MCFYADEQRNFRHPILFHSILLHSTKRFSLGDLYKLPLLSDAGKLLRSYAGGKAEREGYHRHDYLCYRDLLESVGSGTTVALLARRLLCMPPEEAFNEIYT
jgi:hypothetical protein